ncbi:MAG: homocysteine S-methyltransferase family protein [Clostridiales bacterium]|nr:homocysteine S-methyltransferase family protein [Clostridiales bacterium]
MDIKNIIKEKTLILDGAMGTMLQKAGLDAGELPELWNIKRAEDIVAVHKLYVEAGADIVTTNTFQAHEQKLSGYGVSVEDVIRAAVKNAKASGARYVALDVGPAGQLLEPMGTLKFEQAYDMFARQMICGEKNGADLIIIETVSDLYEAKAAVLAAKENTSLPVFCSMTFQEDGRTFVGCDPVSAALSLSGLGVDALGVNCSVGPKELASVVDELLRYSSVPVFAQPNAGMPEYVDGRTMYNISPKEFAGHIRGFVEKGVRIVGGCCGTTPEFIREIVRAVDGAAYAPPKAETVTAACSGSKTVIFDGNVTVIGERINPAGKKKLQEALRENNMDYILKEAISQAAAGGDVLDVNVGLPDIDEAAMMRCVVKRVQSVVNTPLQIDSSDIEVIESGARACVGRPIINSVNGKREVMDAVFPIAKKYGALVVGLTLDENGIPPTGRKRADIARTIVAEAAKHGIPRENLLIDCLVLTASAQQDQVMVTLDAIKLVKSELGVKTALGVSNVSFGLPARERLNAAFLAAAFGAGLDAPILNPLSDKYMEIVDSFRVINNVDKNAARYIEKYAALSISAPVASPKDADLRELIISGRKDETAPAVSAALKSMEPLDIVNSHFIPALNIVGERFEKGEIFLPQLMMSADAVKNGFEVIKRHMEKSGEKPKPLGRIIMATVFGDIHDIGKNIVCMLLENYGYEVIDLGKDVPPETITSAMREKDVKLIGLSALMTTTVRNMKTSIEQIRSENPDLSFMVGGAVLNPEYAKMVGADFYAKDAMGSVDIAKKFFENGRARSPIDPHN